MNLEWSCRLKIGQVISIDIIITSKSIFQKLFVIITESKVNFTPVIISYAFKCR